jgi:SAM-dependent methyltransferase
MSDSPSRDVKPERYSAEYFSRGYRATPFHRQGDKPVLFRAYARLLKKLGAKCGNDAPRLRIVHFGCGEGHLPRRCAGWSDNVGCDISFFAMKQMREGGGTAVCASIDPSCLKSGTFELVTALDVLEHLVDPRPAIKSLYDVLGYGGFAVLSVPNTEGVGRRLKGADWSGYRDDTHRCLVPRGVWLKWFREAGFEVFGVGTDALWDPPYFGGLLRGCQRWMTLTISNVAVLLFGPEIQWPLGDNLIVTLRKAGSGGRGCESA